MYLKDVHSANIRHRLVCPSCAQKNEASLFQALPHSKCSGHHVLPVLYNCPYNLPSYIFMYILGVHNCIFNTQNITIHGFHPFYMVKLSFMHLSLSSTCHFPHQANALNPVYLHCSLPFAGVLLDCQ